MRFVNIKPHETAWKIPLKKEVECDDSLHKVLHRLLVDKVSDKLELV